jgi:hypothetical protein
MFKTLEGKQIMFKMDGFPGVISGRVALSEEAGLWIECKELSDQLVQGISAMKRPIVFVPIHRFSWLISEHPIPLD